ncbi:hypothetical protein HNP48_004892 [Acidovorax soli]|uniref:Uncharacterized protein n=1 Tax=Acidovorax soli TaxID=592050 RepID=A0A7X0UBJ7_9BURK|nr:hypothetical protein [Acidovorax soli]
MGTPLQMALQDTLAAVEADVGGRIGRGAAVGARSNTKPGTGSMTPKSQSARFSDRFRPVAIMVAMAGAREPWASRKQTQST